MIFLTGDAGYIGGHLFDRLRRNGVRFKITRKNLVTLPIHVNCDVVVHLAAQKHGDCYYNNIASTKQVIKRTRPAHFVFASSAAVYGGTTPYAKSKRECERLIRHKCDSYAILRIFNVYGGRQNEGVTYRFQHDNPIIVHGDGTQTRDFIHVERVVDALLLAADYRGKVTVDVGSCQPTRIIDYARTFNKPIVFSDADSGVHNSLAHHHFERFLNVKLHPTHTPRISPSHMDSLLSNQ